MKVSIIIPAYNAEKTIKRAIDSVKAQTYTDWECIIIDDYSQDKTFDVIKSEIGLDSRFIVQLRNWRVGVAEARNFGISASKGDAIFFLDADDWIEPTILEELVSASEHNPGVGRVFSPSIIQWQNGNETEWRVTPIAIHLPNSPYLFASRSCDVGHVTGSLYIRKHLPEGYCFPDVPIYEDMLFNMGLIFAGITTQVTERYLYHYCRYGDSITFGGLSVEDARKIIEALNELGNRFRPDRGVFLRFSRFLRSTISAKIGEKANDL